jgi:steroid delta-isomerase-like uncharacterized protein
MSSEQSPNDPATVIARCFDAFNRYDSDGYAACYTEDVVFDDTALRRTFKGRPELAEFMRDWLDACPDSWMDVGEVVIGDGRAAVAWTGTATLTGTSPYVPETAVRGSRIHQRGLSLMEFGPDGLIRHQTDYYDLVAILQQIGVLPE